jgi:hypothetical protein
MCGDLLYANYGYPPAPGILWTPILALWDRVDQPVYKITILELGKDGDRGQQEEEKQDQEWFGRWGQEEDFVSRCKILKRRCRLLHFLSFCMLRSAAFTLSVFSLYSGCKKPATVYCSCQLAL